MAGKDTLQIVSLIKKEADLAQNLAMIPDNTTLDAHAHTVAKVETTTTIGSGAVPGQSFPLMKLPVEVRRMIFEELLIMPSSIMFRSYVEIEGKGMRYWFTPYATTNTIKKEGTIEEHPARIKESEIIKQSGILNVFLASKTIYRETVPLYYGHNVFEFHGANLFAKFATAIGPECRWQLARVNIGWNGSAFARAAKVMLECVGLRELTLRIYSWSLAPCPSDAPDECRLNGMRDLLRVRGLNMLKLDIKQPLYCYKPGCHCHPDDTKCIAGSQSIAAMKERLEVMKQPLDVKKLRRQEAKDFPVKAKRTVFGEANVVTR